MFHPFAALLACTLISISIFLNIQLGTFTNLFSSIRNPESFWIGYLLFLLSILVHEFGHAAASVRYGAVPSGIGFTLYLIFPALYSDVTTSWKLKSRQRAMVGLGGIYFQLIAAAVYTLLGIFLQTAYFEIAVLMIFGNCLLNLNPVFKFDGYWILSDLLGVVNLHRQPKQIFLYLYNRVRGRAASSLPWLTWISLIIGIYSIGSIFIIGFFILRYSSHFWSLIQKYPAAFQHFFDKLFSRESVSFVEIHTFFLSTIPLVILIYFFYNVVFKALIKKLKNNSDQIK
jgi:putative peptide zinc metalloprotease protein